MERSWGTILWWLLSALWYRCWEGDYRPFLIDREGDTLRVIPSTRDRMAIEHVIATKAYPYLTPTLTKDLQRIIYTRGNRGVMTFIVETRPDIKLIIINNLWFSKTIDPRYARILIFVYRDLLKSKTTMNVVIDKSIFKLT